MQFQRPGNHRAHPHKTTLVLTCVVVFALIVRLINIAFVRNVDEHFVVDYALRFAQGHMHLAWYNWPAQSLMRLNGALFALLHLVQEAVHLQFSAIDASNPLWTTTAHVTTVFISLVCILGTWNVVHRLTRSHGASLLAAWLLSISSLHVIHSRFATPDMLLTTLCVLSIWCALTLLDTLHVMRRRALCIAAGMLIGTALATKYTGAVIVVPLGAAWIASALQQKISARQAVREFLLTLLMAFVTHTFLNPFFFSDFSLVKNAIAQEGNPTRIGADWDGTSGTFWKNAVYYIQGLQAWSGTLISYSAALSIVALTFFRKRIAHMWIVTLFTIAYLVGISLIGLHWSRWALPLTPVVAIATSAGLWSVWTFFSTRIPRFILNTFSALLIIALSLPQLVLSLVIVTHTKNTSDILADCARKNIPAQSTIVADAYLFNALPTDTVKELGVAAYDESLDELRSQGVDAIIVARKRLSDAKQQPNLYPHILARFNELSSLTPVCTAKPTSDDILQHKKDFGVYQWLWTHRTDTHIFDTVDGDIYQLYRL